MTQLQLEIGNKYRLEFAGSETIRVLRLSKIDASPHGRAFVFASDVGARRVFVYEKDLRPVDYDGGLGLIVTDGR